MRTLLTLTLVCTALILMAQPSIEWQNSIGGNANDGVHCIQETKDGGYIMAAYSNSTAGEITGLNATTQGWLIKMSSAGLVEWKMALGPKVLLVSSLQQTVDEGYILRGTGMDSGVRKDFVAKYSKNIDLEWISYIETVSKCNVIELVDGYITIGTSRLGSNNYKVIVSKLSTTGEFIWQKELEEIADNKLFNITSIHETIDGGYVFAGTQKSSVFGEDLCIVKLSNDGSLEWQKTLDSPGDQFAKDIQKTSDGGFVVGAKTTAGDPTSYIGDCWILKFGLDGTLEWDKTIGGSDSEYTYSIAQTKDGGYILGAETESRDGDVEPSDKGQSNLWIVKLTDSGDIDWQKILGGSRVEGATAVIESSDNAYVAAGYSVSSDGDLSTNQGQYDIWVIKLSKPNSVPKDLDPTLVSIFPNPTTDWLNINLDQQLQTATYQIHNTAGQLLKVGQLDAASNQIYVNQLATGLYTCRINTTQGQFIHNFIKD